MLNICSHNFLVNVLTVRTWFYLSSFLNKKYCSKNVNIDRLPLLTALDSGVSHENKLWHKVNVLIIGEQGFPFSLGLGWLYKHNLHIIECPWRRFYKKINLNKIRSCQCNVIFFFTFVKSKIITNNVQTQTDGYDCVIYFFIVVFNPPWVLKPWKKLFHLWHH